MAMCITYESQWDDTRSDHKRKTRDADFLKCDAALRLPTSEVEQTEFFQDA